MRPIHSAAYWDGVKTLYLGPSGNSGREALQKMIEGVRGGQNAMVMSDGPAGPRRKMRPGVALAAVATGLPIVPLRFDATGCWNMGDWDRKLLPIPFFFRIVLKVGAPISVTAEAQVPAALVAVAYALGEGVPQS